MLFERDSEIETLNRAVGDLDSLGGRVILIRGEAGIGKSALIGQFMSDIKDRAHVLLGTCDDLLTPQPLGPIWDIARQETSVARSLSDGDRRAVMEVLLDLLSRALRPTLLVLEDTQWQGKQRSTSSSFSLGALRGPMVCSSSHIATARSTPATRSAR